MRCEKCGNMQEAEGLLSNDEIRESINRALYRPKPKIIGVDMGDPRGDVCVIDGVIQPRADK